MVEYLNLDELVKIIKIMSKQKETNFENIIVNGDISYKIKKNGTSFEIISSDLRRLKINV